MSDRRQDNTPWYVDGLRFECQPDCGACCTNHGDYAYVYLDEPELGAIARHLKLTPAQFKRRYTVLDDGARVLRMDQPDCPFLEGQRCGIYPVRPVQCRTFPFWSENLASPRAWKKLKSFCPGVGKGDPVPLLQIEKHRIERGE